MGDVTLHVNSEHKLKVEEAIGANKSSVNKSSVPSSTWTKKQNELFEDALAIYDPDKPGWWENIVKHIGGEKTVEEVKLHYEKLVEDIKDIEEDKVPIPDYKY